MKLMKISKKIALILFFGCIITLKPWIVFADEEIIVPQDESLIIIDTPSSTDSNLSETPTSTQESETITNETAGPTVHFIVRYEDQFVFNDTIPLPTSTAITYHENGSENQQITQTNQSSVLAALVTADNLSDNFLINDLAYYSSFNSYLLNCIAISNPIVATPCYNWNYIVDNTYPLVGMDQNILRGGETVYVYFSNPWRIIATTSTFPLGTTTTFQTERFQYDNLSSPWVADPNDQISISIPNPNPTGWWDTTITVSTTMSDSDGLANFLFDATGTYSVQITSPDFSKYSNPININVTELPITEETAEASTETQEASESQQGGGSGGSSSAIVAHDNLNIEKAIQFLLSHQNADGSLGNLLTTDWAAIAFATNSSIPTNLRAYLISNPNPGNSLTDIERRAMAIMSLGINPYNGTATNYIEAILNQFHDNQFGDIALINDDIFALFPLIKAGVQTDDPRIQSAVQSIISFQNQNGSWGSVDLTSAAIQALSLVPNATGVSTSISKARQYLVEEQQIDGSFDHNPFATAWAMQAIKALGESSINWQKGGHTPGDYLASIQNNDGAMNTNPNDATTRLWGTSYAIVGALEKPWQQILQNFFPPQTSAQNSQSGSVANLMNSDPVQTTTTVQIYEQTASTMATSTQNNTETLEIIPPRIEETIPTAKDTIPPQTKQLPIKNKFEQTIIVQTVKENLQILPETNLIEATIQTSNPIQENAKKVFATSAALTSTLGLYLGWRLLLALL